MRTRGAGAAIGAALFVATVMLGLGPVAPVAVASDGALVGAANVSLAQGVYSGFTSQPGYDDQVRFRLLGPVVAGETVLWQAKCRSGKSLVEGTRIREIYESRGRWNEATTYVGRLLRGAYPTSLPVTGRFRVVENTGRFTSAISASGVERVTATLYRQGRQIDSCATGPVRWTAGNTSAIGSPSPLTVPASATIGGLTYAQWVTKEWQWAIATLHSHHSSAPRTSSCVTTGQQGPVWFPWIDDYDLGSTKPVTVTCHVPQGHYVLLSSPSYECSTAERPPYHATTDAGLLRCAHVRSANSLLLDDQIVTPAGFPVSTGVFTFTMPSEHNFLDVPGKSHGRGAAYGRPIILGPLPAGSHTIIQTFNYGRYPAYVSTLRLLVS
jgi:hypothetical protein